MSKPGEIKKKLQALSVPGVRGLICDILIDYDKQSDNYAEEAGEIGYSRYVDRACSRMKGIYEKQLRKNDLIASQRDLEELIKEIKEEEEKRK